MSNITSLSASIYLENTQTIFNGIDRLYQLNLLPSEINKDTASFVREQWEKCRPQTAISEKESYRYNNPLSLFFDFLIFDPYNYKRKDIDEEIKKDLINMLNMYKVSAELDRLISNDSVPEEFEELCCCMRDIMNSEMCYLLHSQRDQVALLSTSSPARELVYDESAYDGNVIDNAFSYSFGTSMFSSEDFENLRMQIRSERKKYNNKSIPIPKRTSIWPLKDTIFVPSKESLVGKKLLSEGKGRSVVIVIDYMSSNDASGRSEWIYLVFQYSPESLPSDEELLRYSRNLLFMREKIMNLCMKNMFYLAVVQRSYQYVPIISTNNESVKILHITDLHLQIDENQAQILSLADIIASRANEDENVDLLIISGDVVQANYSAGLLEKNYQFAEAFIRKLACSLWPKKGSENYVRADWQKRIIIIPGNHDYASMNELKADSIPGIKRVLGSGYPARNEGGPMVKYAYYINFLCRLLNLDMNAIINNHLNEVRCYRKMGLSFVAVNTISEVGPKRTNKVFVNFPYVEHLVESIDFKYQFPIVICHHTPNYDISYLMDRYWENCKADEKTQKAWIEKFVGILEAIQETLFKIPHADIQKGTRNVILSIS